MVMSMQWSSLWGFKGGTTLPLVAPLSTLAGVSTSEA